MAMRTKRRDATRIDIQELEDRRLLVAFGTPWPDARDLTISIPADGVDIGPNDNVIRQTLDQVATREEWTELALRAYQTWSIVADINVGVRNDFDLPFGAPGLSTGDPRFGEFRIGAFPQMSLLANSIPFQAVAGTYSGDLLINSNESFHFHDWAGDQAPDPATLGPNDRDLFSLLLHETGNTLGLADNDSTLSVMFRQYSTPKGVLTQEDIDSIQALYGARTDPYESIDNGQVAVATVVSTPVGFDTSADVIRFRGSLKDSADLDHYKIIPVAGQDSATVRLRASGISLLQSKLEIVDASGQSLAQASSVSVTDNDNVLQVTGLLGQSEVYIRVSAADAASVYSVGDYVLEIDYRAQSVQAMDATPGDFDSGVDSLFTHFDLIDDEVIADTISSASVLSQVSFVTEGERYELESSIGGAVDLDVYQVTAPSAVQGRLVVHVAGVGAGQADVRAEVLDSGGQPIGTAARLHSDGTFTVEVAEPVADTDYYIRISVDANSAVSVGNYVVTAEFEAPAQQMFSLFSTTTTNEDDVFIRWTATKTKLFRFDLDVDGGTSDQGIRLVIYDAHTYDVRAVVFARSGLTRTGLTWLQQGDYILQFSVMTPSGVSGAGLTYSLFADGVSDDQDDETDDEMDPTYNYAYEYGWNDYEYCDYQGNGDYGYDYDYNSYEY